MEQIKVSLQMCNSGDILAQDVFNNNGIILVPKDTQMNDFIRERLIEWGQSEVFIFKQFSIDDRYQTNQSKQVKQSYAAAIRGLKRLIGNLSAGKNVDYKEVLFLSELVFDQVNECNSIVKYLNEVKNYDDYTYTHCLNTAFYCMLISKWMKMSEDEVRLAIQAGLLHDIGKIDIPRQILNKKGILTKEEYEIIKMHTTYGYSKADTFCGNNLISEEVKKAILLHHERVDGSGYPFKITAEEINFFARIVSVGDVFDAMTSDRVYKKRCSPFDAFEMFKTVGISIFDTDIINIFVKNIALYYTDSEVLLSNGSVGNIVYVPPQDITRPIVKVASKYLDLSKEDGVKLVRVI